jgi:hypothetical protein
MSEFNSRPTGVVGCRTCGLPIAAGDPGVDAMGRHRLWHERHPHQSEEATR